MPLTIDNPVKPSHVVYDLIFPLQTLLAYLKGASMHVLNLRDYKLLRIFGLKSTYVPLGTDTELFRCRFDKPNTFTMVYASRPSWHKGTDLLINYIIPRYLRGSMLWYRSLNELNIKILSVGQTSMKIGIVGCGFVANYHVKAWRSVGAEVLAVADVIEDRARDFAHRHNIPYSFRSVEDMLNGVKLDVLSICTPPQAHKEVALEAVKRGVSVFVEKPLVLRYSDAVEIVNEVRSRGVKLGVTANLLFTPTMVKARDLVERGVVGELKRVDVVVYAPEDVILNPEGGWLKSLPGGVFGEVLPHPIYLLQSLIGKLDLISVSTARISRSVWQKYDELHALLKGERGLGRIIVSYNAKHFDIYMIIEGDKGYILVNPVGKIIAKLNSNWKYTKNILSFRYYAMLWLDYILGRVPRDQFTENIKIFKNHVEGDSPYIFNYDDILNQVKVYEEILSSLEQH
jgi:predicted dehydrogenase